MDGADHFHVWGTGKPFREFLYVDDLAEALTLMLKQYSGASHVNIGSGKEISIKTLSQKVADAVGFDGEIIFDPSKPDGMHRKVMDNSIIYAAGWSPRISMEQGLKHAYQNYLDRFETISQRLKA